MEVSQRGRRETACYLQIDLVRERHDSTRGDYRQPVDVDAPVRKGTRIDLHEKVWIDFVML